MLLFSLVKGFFREMDVANRNVLAVGASAGGVEALLYLVAHLEPEFPAAILVTIHLPDYRTSFLDELLTGAGSLPAKFAAHGDRLVSGKIYIAPPGRHLILEGEDIRLGEGPRENNVRPAIDPMLRSVAVCCGHRAVGVVLTGTQGDGASGLWAISHCGGVSVVQDPADAAFPEMPMTALNQSRPQYVIALAEMPELLDMLARQPAADPIAIPDNLKFEVDVARKGHSGMNEMDEIGRRSVLACPDCHGVMWEIDEGDLVRYRCHEGHAYTAEVMGIALEDNVRRALASAARALEERVALAERLKTQAKARGMVHAVATWTERKKEYEAEADVIRKAIRRADELAVKLAKTA